MNWIDAREKLPDDYSKLYLVYRGFFGQLELAYFDGFYWHDRNAYNLLDVSHYAIVTDPVYDFVDHIKKVYEYFKERAGEMAAWQGEISYIGRHHPQTGELQVLIGDRWISLDEQGNEFARRWLHLDEEE